MKRYLIFSFTLATMAVFSCGGSTEKKKTENPNAVKTDTAKKAADTNFNRKYNDYAFFIAGLPSKAGSSMAMYEGVKEVQEHAVQFGKRWDEMDKNRLSLMRKWAKEELHPKVDENLNTFYPFSGPDFLHVVQFYPNSKKYLFLANEMVGNVPEFEKMTRPQVLNYLNSIEKALGDIFRRSYFITSYMGSQIPAVKGVIPIFMVFFARTGHEIMNVELISIDAAGNTVPRSQNPKGVSGVRFTFCPAGKYDDVRTLEYFNTDISNVGTSGNGGLKARPEMVKHIEAFGKANTFVKAASYLLHYETFSTIKDLTQAKSVSLLQDDTGIPYRFLAKDFNYSLYGKYTIPVKNFSASGHYQKDLGKLYADSTKVKSLPFSLGYHWQDKNQNYMLFVRKP
ncbi:MAG: hypothetical protein EBV15_02575 [Bacteroidetes bacterium]|jgi:hypothetical protein|nr:hypothetical protein [Bacteroidota bacterium]